MKTKILMIIPSLRIGGAEKLCLELSRSINKDLYEIYIVSLSNSIPLISAYGNEDIKVVTVGKPESLIFPWIHLKSLLKFVYVISKIKPNIIHSHLWGEHCLYLYPFLFIKNKYKFIATIHSSGLHYTSDKIIMRVNRYIEKKIYKLLKINLVTISNAVNEMTKRILCPQNIYRIDNGIDTDKFYPSSEIKFQTRKILNINKFFPILIHVGRSAEEKRQIDIIQATLLLKESYDNILLILVGRENEEKYGKYVKDLKLDNNIRFINETNNINNLLNAADIAIFPSLYEGLSLSLAEKMSCELPIIISNIPELLEMTNMGECALIVPIKDPLEIALKVKEIIKNNELKNRIKKKAREIAIERYSIKRMTKEYEKLYNQINID